MSRMVREYLKMMDLFFLTTHEDRFEIDREIERRTGKNCDEAIEQGMVSKKEFRKIVDMILKLKKKKRKEIETMVI